MKSVLGGLLNKTPVPLSPSGRSTISLLNPMMKSSPEQQMKAMGEVGTLFGIVNRTSNATSQVEWKLYRKVDGRGRQATQGQWDGQARKEVTSHAALDLWNKPNQFYTQQEYVETFQQHQDLTGEAWWLVSKAEGFDFPLEMWPLRPDRMQVVPSATEFIKGYIYVGPDGEKIPLERDEVIQLRLPNPLDPYRGMGPVQSILSVLDSEKYSLEWNRNFFRNSAQPGGIIQVDKRLTDDEFDEMTSRWAEQHRGVSKAHRVAVIEQGQWKDNSYSMRDMQFAQLRQVSRDTILEAFSFPKAMLGIVEDVNRANAEANEYVFAKYLLIPRLERIKQALNFEFLPLFGSTGQGLEFDYESPVPDDRAADSAEFQSKVNSAKTLIDAGFDPKETLSAVGLPDIPFIKKEMATV